ncbi:MAG: hypothetical protein Q9216_005931 [Gyalolechia sp. 2 TL-2023]
MDAVNHQDRTPSVYGGSISLIVIVNIAIVARLYARKISNVRLWWDDFIIILALVTRSQLQLSIESVLMIEQLFDWGISVGIWLDVKYGGFGRHSARVGGPVNDEEFSNFFKIFLALELLYLCCSTATKASLVLLYYRIFRLVKWFRWLLALAWATVFIYFFVCVFVAIFECKPVSFKWDKTIEGGTCIDQDKFYRLNGIANLLIDFMLWSLTLPVVWRLNLNFRQKLSVSGIFLLGLLACTASIVRVVTFNQVREIDSTYTLVNVILWSAIEQSTGIVCACLPTTRPILGRLLTKMKRSDKNSDGTPKNHPEGIALTSYHSRRNLHGSLDTSKSGFARLDERGIDGTITVTTDISKTLSDGTPVMPQRILKQQTFEQRVDNGHWFSGPV